MSKETNDAWVNAHYGHDAHPIADSKPAAAQEEGTVEIIGRTYLLHDVTAALAKAGHAPVAAAPGIDLHAPCTEAVYALARKLLWVAYVWNDHNFDHPYKIARKLAAEFGIESFDQANAWLDEQAKLIDASPKGQ